MTTTRRHPVHAPGTPERRAVVLALRSRAVKMAWHRTFLYNKLPTRPERLDRLEDLMYLTSAAHDEHKKATGLVYVPSEFTLYQGPKPV